MNSQIPEASRKKHIAILGMNGSGKTSVAKRHVIEPALADGERVCNIDPTGVGWGLRLKADGKTKGFPVYIVGGDHADFPLQPRDGKAWADIVGTSSDSFVFDTSLMTVEGRSQWFADFAETVIRRNKGPLHLVIDEAHLFAPQGGSKVGGTAPRMLHATNNLLALGRSRGLRITMISQRPAKLHKDSLTQAHTLIAMSLMAPQDRNAVKDWIADQADTEAGKEIIASLPNLKPGEGYIWAPKEGVLERVQFSRPTTFDSSSAPDDADGGNIQLSAINPDAIKAKLAEVAKETVANDPAKLRAEIARLNAELAKKPGLVADPMATVQAENLGYERGQSDAWEVARKTIDEEIRRIKSLVEPFADAILKFPATPFKLIGRYNPGPSTSKRSVERPGAAQPAKVVRATPSPRTAGDGTEMGAERRPLGVLAAALPAGMTEAQWAVAAGMKRSGGTFQTYKSRLRTAGRIEQRGNEWFATEQGVIDLGGEIPRLPSPGPELVEFWAARISGAGPMLRALAERYPEWQSRPELADALGMAVTGGTFNTYLSRLRSPGLIEIENQSVRAAPALMTS